MNSRQKIALAVSDFFLAWLSLLLALGLRVDFVGDKMARWIDHQLWFFNAIGLSLVLVFHLFGLYDRLWRYAGVREMTEVLVAVTIVLTPFEFLVLIGRGLVFPRTGLVLAWFITIAFCGGLRFLFRIAAENQNSHGEIRRAYVVGANDAGESVYRELNRGSSPVKVVGFISTPSDDSAGGSIRGIKILGTLSDLPELLESSGVRELVLAQLPPGEVAQVVQICEGLEVSYSVVPSVADLVGGKVQVKRLRELRIEDLLERDVVSYDEASVRGYLEGKRILVTGAGGSIGSEICRQVLRSRPREIVALGRGENSIYEIVTELSDPCVRPVIVDVRDAHRLRQTFSTFRPQVVFHAAAHKHVPLMEDAPAEAVANNVRGSLNVMELCQEFSVEKMIVLSTDKAVNPGNVMGATKRLCEMLLLQRCQTGMAAVRFGNVLGSRGSVVPTFLQQIERGGPVTVTDPEMTRFFMTIPEAVALVLQAGALAQGGEIYVLDMGKPVKIIEMARNLVRLSGFEPGRDIEIKIVGARPGEKLHEAFVGEGESSEATSTEKVKRVVSHLPDGWPGSRLEDLLQAAEEGDDVRCRDLLNDLVKVKLPAAELGGRGDSVPDTNSR